MGAGEREKERPSYEGRCVVLSGRERGAWSKEKKSLIIAKQKRQKTTIHVSNQITSYIEAIPMA